MALKDARGYLRGNRAVHALLDNVLLACAVRHENDFLCLHDRPHAHRDGLCGNLVAAREEACVRVDRDGIELYLMGSCIKYLIGLIESDVSVMSDTEQLDVGASERCNELVVARAFL